MANQLSAFPWVVDTPSDDVLYERYLKVSQIEYVGWTDPAHVAEVQDKNGNIVAILSGNTVTKAGHKVGWFSGLLVPLLTTIGPTNNLQSGMLIFYME